MKWKNLLVPHDFSIAAERAHELACDLAEMCGARVILLHVSQIPHGFTGDSKLVVDGSNDAVRIEDYLVEAGRRRLESAAQGKGAVVDIRAVVTGGDFRGAILEHWRRSGPRRHRPRDTGGQACAGCLRSVARAGVAPGEGASHRRARPDRHDRHLREEDEVQAEEQELAPPSSTSRSPGERPEAP
ncbi:MAG: universal stress protein [Polyangiaceae bacterium]